MKSIFLLLLCFLPTAVFCQNQVETRIDRFPNGIPRAEYSFYREKDGLEVWHGKRIEWTQNGRRFSEGFFLDGKAEGRRTYWHENGRKSSEGNYRRDLPTGVWLHWHPNGQLQQRCEYENGKKHGTCFYWDGTSRDVDTVEYINGDPLAIVEWKRRNVLRNKAVYLYPYILVRPGNLTFTSNYAGISKESPVGVLEGLFLSLPKSVWVNGKEIGITKVGLASRDDHRRMNQMMEVVVSFFRSKGYRIQYLPH